MLRRYNGNKGNNSGGDINESAPVLPDPGHSTPLLSSPLIHYGQLQRRRLMMIFFFFFALLSLFGGSSYLGRFLFENTMSLILYQRQYKQHYWNDAFEISNIGHITRQRGMDTVHLRRSRLRYRILDLTFSSLFVSI